MKHKVTLEGSGKTVICESTQTVLSALASAGVKEIQIGCRSGGCGVCRVQVLRGQFRSGLMSAAHIDSTQLEEGYALACKLYPDSDLEVRAIGRLTQNLCSTQRHHSIRRIGESQHAGSLGCST